MNVPTIGFSLDNEIYRPAQTVDGKLVPADTFGPDFGGSFVLKWPTLGDQARISARWTAYWQAQGVNDPMNGVPMGISQVMHALFFFGVLATQKPDWVSETTQDSPKFQAAMIRALVMAQQRLGEEKKTSDVTGASTSQQS